MIEFAASVGSAIGCNTGFRCSGRVTRRWNVTAAQTVRPAAGDAYGFRREAATETRTLERARGLFPWMTTNLSRAFGIRWACLMYPVRVPQ